LTKGEKWSKTRERQELSVVETWDTGVNSGIKYTGNCDLATLTGKLSITGKG
jgi:hypothetical protein